MVRRHRRHRLVIDEKLTLGRGFEARQHTQQGGLATAGGPEKGEELTAGNVHIYVVDRVNLPEMLRDAAQGDEILITHNSRHQKLC